MMTITQRRRLLEGLRSELGLTKSAFAAHLGISAPEYSNILVGYRGVQAHLAYTLARLLDRTPQSIAPQHSRTYRAVRMYWLASEGVQDTTAPSGGATVTKPFRISVEG